MQRRILLLVIISITLVLVSVGFASHISVSSSIDKSMRDHLLLAGIIGKNIDYLLQQNISRLHDISASGLVDMSDGSWDDERAALKTAYEYSIFSDGLFIMNPEGKLLVTYPSKDYAELGSLDASLVRETMIGGKTLISDVQNIEGSDKKVIFILVPLKDLDGNILGVVGGEINPANYMFTLIIKSNATDNGTIIELVDRKGIVISSNDPEAILSEADHNAFLAGLINRKESFVGECHRCHQKGQRVNKKADMMAFSPLAFSPWGVSVRESQDIIFGPSNLLRRTFAVISMSMVAAAAVLSLGLSRSIIHPISVLTSAASRIAQGNLNEPIKIQRRDEIGTLSTSFELMRNRLKESYDSIRQHNLELESRVQQRTEELNERKKQLSSLLDERMRAQEEERKRVARLLHDDTSQSLAALGMSIDIATMALKDDALTPKSLMEIKARTTAISDELSAIIKDLRPPLLDDLGLEAIVNWLLERNLTGNGIRYRSNSEAFNQIAVSKSNELRIFRVLQEATHNITRHSKATFVCLLVEVDDGSLVMRLTDDGVGFDVQRAFEAYKFGTGLEGYGLLGMRERVEHMSGRLEIESYPGEGAQITITIPMNTLEV